MGAPEAANIGDMGAGTPGKKLMVETDRPIYVAINDSARLWPVENFLAMASDGITSLYFQNTDASNTATVVFVITN